MTTGSRSWWGRATHDGALPLRAPVRASLLAQAGEGSATCRRQAGRAAAHRAGHAPHADSSASCARPQPQARQLARCRRGRIFPAGPPVPRPAHSGQGHAQWPGRAVAGMAQSGRHRRALALPHRRCPRQASPRNPSIPRWRRANYSAAKPSWSRRTANQIRHVAALRQSPAIAPHTWAIFCFSGKPAAGRQQLYRPAPGSASGNTSRSRPVSRS